MCTTQLVGSDGVSRAKTLLDVLNNAGVAHDSIDKLLVDNEDGLSVLRIVQLRVRCAFESEVLRAESEQTKLWDHHSLSLGKLARDVGSQGSPDCSWACLGQGVPNGLSLFKSC